MSRRREDGETKEALHQIVNEMYKKLEKGETPTMTLPVRTKLNIDFDKKLPIYYRPIYKCFEKVCRAN